MASNKHRDFGTKISTSHNSIKGKAKLGKVNNYDPRPTHRFLAIEIHPNEHQISLGQGSGEEESRNESVRNESIGKEGIKRSPSNQTPLIPQYRTTIYTHL
jgi:hypothetical protein